MGVERNFLEVSTNTWRDAESCTTNERRQHWHYHDQFELHAFWNFSGQVAVGGHRGALVEHSVFLLAPNIAHAWIGKPTASDPGGDAVVDCAVLFREHHTARILQLFPELRNLESLLADSGYGVEISGVPDIHEIGDRILELEQLEGCRRFSQFLAVLDRLASCPRKLLNVGNSVGPANFLASENLKRALAYTRQNFRTNLTLEQAAEVAVMSPSHFCRSFKKAYGVGFVEYVNKLRVECTCELLRSSRRPIASIAYECGFVNISNFNRNFKKYVKQSPSEFRRSL